MNSTKSVLLLCLAIGVSLAAFFIGGVMFSPTNSSSGTTLEAELAQARTEIQELKEDLVKARSELAAMAAKSSTFPTIKKIPWNGMGIFLKVKGSLPEPGTVVDLLVDLTGEGKVTIILPNTGVMITDTMPKGYGLFLLNHEKSHLLQPYFKTLDCRFEPPRNYIE